MLNNKQHGGCKQQTPDCGTRAQKYQFLSTSKLQENKNRRKGNLEVSRDSKDLSTDWNVWTSFQPGPKQMKCNDNMQETCGEV